MSTGVQFCQCYRFILHIIYFYMESVWMVCIISVGELDNMTTVKSSWAFPVRFPFDLWLDATAIPFFFFFFVKSTLLCSNVRVCSRPAVRHCEVIKGLLKSRLQSVLRHSPCLHSCICSNDAHAYFITTISAKIFLKDSTHTPPP